MNLVINLITERKDLVTERRKLELQLNQPTEIELLYDEPVCGKSQYGEYFLYAIKSEESEYAFFAPMEIHEQLQYKKKGDIAIVQKLAVQKGSKVVTSYKVDFPDAPIESETIKNQVAPSVADTIENLDKYYNIMLKSYKDSFRLQEELGGMVDIEKIAITLFISRSK